MSKSYLQCKVLHKLNNSNAKTEEEPITHSASRYKIEFAIGDIGRGDPDKSADTFVSDAPDTPQSIDNWYQTIAFAVNNNDYWPTETLKYSWYKNGEVKISSIQNRYRSITIPVPTTNNETWKGELYTTTNFFICSYETTLTSRPAPQDVESNTLIVDLVGQSLFLIKEDGTWPNNQAPSHTITAYLTYHDQTGNISFPATDECEFKWLLADAELAEINNNEEGTDLTNSAFKEIKITGNVLEFVAKSPYLSTYIENLISCEVTYSFAKDGSEIQEVIGHGQYEPSFVRNGQPGTNGTSFLCRFTTDGGNSFPEYLISSANVTNLSAVVKNVVNNSVVELAETSYYYEGNSEATNFSDINKHYALYAICKSAGVPFSTYYTSIPIIHLGSQTTIIEPTTSLQVVFGQSGRLASGLPITITLGSGSSTIKSLEGKYLKATQEESVITISLKDTFEKYNGDISYEILILQDGTMIPILLSSNRFEYTAINGWDGTSVKIDETNDTVLAPTAGFGKKENDNSFTGVMLGSIIPTGENYEIIKCSSVTTNKAMYDGTEILPGESTVNKFYLDESDIAEGRSQGQYYVTRKSSGSRYYFEKTLPPDFTGILGMNHGNTTFSLDSNTGSLFAKGHIEATSGKIGGVKIEALRETGNRNLLLESGTSHVATEKKIATYTPSSPLNAGEIYTVTMLCKPDPQKRVDKISLLSSQSYMSVVNLSFTTEEKDNYDNYYRKTATFTMKYYPNMSPSDDLTNAEISFWQYNNSSETVVGNCEIKWVKIEKGVYSSDWSPAPEDLVSTNVNNNYSWLFSPSNGMFMWNGAQGTISSTDPTGGAVFSITQEKGLYMRGNGEFTGKITANEGEIAGWGVVKYSDGGYLLSCRDNTGKILEPTWSNFVNSENRVGLFTNCPASLTIGTESKTTWRIIAGKNFGVDANGNIFAESGQIGPWQLSSNSFTNTNDGAEFLLTGNSLMIGKELSNYGLVTISSSNDKNKLITFSKTAEASETEASIYCEDGKWYLDGFGFSNISGGIALSNGQSLKIKDTSGGTDIEVSQKQIKGGKIQGTFYSSDGTQGATNTTFAMPYMASAVNGYTLYMVIKNGLITSIYTKDT